MNALGRLEIDRLRAAYGTGPTAVTAVDEVSLRVDSGEFVCIVGPSGCGKTTLLRSIAGLLPTTAGSVTLDGRLVDEPPLSMALVFQDYSRSLLPWMTVQANVTLPLRGRRVPRAERSRRAADALAAVGLAGQGRRYPWQLSAGMQQRVALARALVYEPQVLLLDEPFASVDAQTRSDLQDLLLAVWQRTAVTVVLITHDVDEAVYLGDRVVVLSASPARVRETIGVDLPRPRDQIRSRQIPAFARLRARVFATVRDEAHRLPTGERATSSGTRAGRGTDVSGGNQPGNGRP